MLKIFLSFIICSQTTLAWTQSAPRLINFNLKDSMIWSAALRKINLTEIKDASGNKFESLIFKSADRAFQINCFTALSSSPFIANRPTTAQCLIHTDQASSVLGVTQFESLSSNQIQKITLQDPADLQLLNALVANNKLENYYETTEVVSIANRGEITKIPRLTAKCSSSSDCEITVVKAAQ